MNQHEEEGRKLPLSEPLYAMECQIQKYFKRNDGSFSPYIRKSKQLVKTIEQCKAPIEHDLPGMIIQVQRIKNQSKVMHDTCIKSID